VAFIINKENYKEEDYSSTYIGFKLPFALGTNQNVLHSKTMENIKDNLVNLIKTKPGERIFHPRLGIDINGLLFEQMSGDIEQFTITLREEVEAQVRRWMPFLSITTFEVNENVDSNTYKLKLGFALTRNTNLYSSVEIDFGTEGQ
tara:strand:+ start:511 stop:948 length:438 start_codon:yes stop_codon:yes gene_type:complete